MASADLPFTSPLEARIRLGQPILRLTHAHLEDQLARGPNLPNLNHEEARYL